MRIMITIVLEAGVEIEIIGEEKSLGPNLTLEISTNCDCMRCY